MLTERLLGHLSLCVHALDLGLECDSSLCFQGQLAVFLRFCLSVHLYVDMYLKYSVFIREAILVYPMTLSFSLE